MDPEESLQLEIDEVLKRFLLDRIPAFEPPVDSESWSRRIPELRQEALEKVFLQGFPAEVVDRLPRVVWGETFAPDAAYTIRKLRYEAYPDYWIPALLYEPAVLSGEKVPVVLNPNGHHAGGKTADYKQARCVNLVRRGMISLNFEFIGMSELGADSDHNRLSYLELTGMAAPGLMYLAMKKALDVLLDHEYADPDRVAMTGLSGGGWQTIVLSALDPRITASIPVAGYTSVRARVEDVYDVGDLEQVPADLTTVLDFQEMTAMLAPRPALLILNEYDTCCFQTYRTKPVIYDAVKPVYESFGAAERFAFHNNVDPGTHNYESDNRAQLYRFLNKHFGLDTPEHDLHREDELLTELELRVGLPEEQQTIPSIATARARKLAGCRSTPVTAEDRRALRERLREVLRLPEYEARGELPAEGKAGTVMLEVGPWTVPVTALVRDGEEIEVAIADDGRVAGAEHSTRSYLAADILGTGQCRAHPRLQMVVGCCGDRLLGIQVAQVLAISRWAARGTEGSRLHLAGNGTMSAVVTLMATALEPEMFRTLTVTGELSSLNHLIERGIEYEAAQSLFSFGLLEIADVPDLVRLLEHVAYLQPERAVPPTIASKLGS
jgi:dienelactone hydrolase